MEINLSSFNDIRTYFFVPPTPHISLFPPLKLMNFSQYPHPQIYVRTLFVGLIQTNHIPHSPFLVWRCLVSGFHHTTNRQYRLPVNTNSLNIVYPQYCHVEPFLLLYFFFFWSLFFSERNFYFFWYSFTDRPRSLGEYLIYLCIKRCWQYSRWMNQRKKKDFPFTLSSTPLWSEMCKDSRSLCIAPHVASRTFICVWGYIYVANIIDRD